MVFKTFDDGDVLTAADVNDYLMQQSVIECTSGTRPASPGDGMVIYETDTDKLLLREASTAWRRIPIDRETNTPVSHYQGALDTSGSTSYVAGTDNGIAFTAPPSGSVYVSISGTIGTNAVTVTAGTFYAFEIRTGSTLGGGTVVQAADDTRAVLYQPNNPTAGQKYAPAHLRLPVTGLTKDTSYHARTMFRSDTGGGTAAATRRHVVVEPVL